MMDKQEIIVSKGEIKSPTGAIMCNGVTVQMMLDNGFDENGIIEVKKNQLIKQTSELVREKMSAINSVVLGIKETLAEFYDWKYKQALVDEFEGDENQLIIQNHEAQVAATDAYVMKINTARDGVMGLIEAEEFDKAEIALKRFRSFGADTTEQDIEQVL